MTLLVLDMRLDVRTMLKSLGQGNFHPDTPKNARKTRHFIKRNKQKAFLKIVL